MRTTTLLGPHFLNTPTDANVKALEQWQPPVCLVLFGNVFNSDLQRDLGMLAANNYTPKDIAATVLDDTSFDNWIGSIAGHLRPDDEIRAVLKPLFKSAKLADTKIIGRIYIPDATVKAHLEQHVTRTAAMHDTVVDAVRNALYSSTSANDMSNFVDYWVIANEVRRRDTSPGTPESYTTYLGSDVPVRNETHDVGGQSPSQQHIQSLRLWAVCLFQRPPSTTATRCGYP